MSEQKVMLFEDGFDQGIRCRFISKWFKIDSYVPTKEKLLSEIEKNNPDVVFLDLDLYAKIDGIETSRKIRKQFNVPVMYV
jgi:DNA-binding response OmpR family regulator